MEQEAWTTVAAGRRRALWCGMHPGIHRGTRSFSLLYNVLSQRALLFVKSGGATPPCGHRRKHSALHNFVCFRLPT